MLALQNGEALTERRISGTQDTQLSDTGQGVLYGTFAIMGFFAGSINVSYHRAPICGALVTTAYLGRLQNMLGPRLTLSLGTTGYSLYIGSLWAYQVHGTRWFLILAGALLGISISSLPLILYPG